MKLIGTFQGADVYTAEDILVLRDHGGGIELELSKSIAKFKRNHDGKAPVVVLTTEQLDRMDKQGIEAEAQERAAAARAAKKAGAEPPEFEPKPGPFDAEPDAEPEFEFDPTPADTGSFEIESEPAPE